MIVLTDIYRIFYPKAAEYTFFSSAYGTSSRTDHSLGHKWSLGKIKKTEIISSIFSNLNAMKLEINYRREKTVQHTNTQMLNNMLLHNQWITEETKDETENPRNKWQQKHDSQNIWDATRAILRRNFIAVQSHLKGQEKNLKQPKLILEATRERTKPTASRKKS